MLADLRYAWRQLRLNPGFAVTAVAVLALGIGVATAMFSVLDAALLRPLPFRDANSLVIVGQPVSYGNIAGAASEPDFRDWQQRSRSFAQLAFSVPKFTGMQLPRQAAMVTDDACSANLFDLLGAAPELGRGFIAADQANRSKVAVLSDRLWRTYFDARRDAIGQTIKLGNDAYTVVGVMPAGFSFPYGDMDLWTPYAPDTAQAAQRDDYQLQVVGRLRPGVTPRAAQVEVSGIQASIAHQFSKEKLADRVVVERYRDHLVAQVRPALEALAAAVAMVWLIACVAVAGLLLTRFAVRRRELAVRAALGAGRGRLAGQLLAESLLLGGIACITGAGLAWLAITAVGRFLAGRMPAGMAVHASWSVLAGLVGLTLLSVVLIGLLPALLAARAPAQAGLRIGGSVSGSRGQSRLRDLLVVAELALALMLLTSAGLLLRTLYALRQVPLGFTPENVVSTQIMLPPGRFEKQSISDTFYQPLLARLQALPGVQAAALTSVVPLQRSFNITGRLAFRDRPGLPDDQQPAGLLRFTSAGYAQVLGIKIEQGRFFDGRDIRNSPPVMVVNHAFAAKYYPGRTAVGGQIGFGKNQTATIVGVMADVHESAIETPPEPLMLFDTTQLAPGDSFYQLSTYVISVAVRTRMAPESQIPSIRAALHAVAPDLAPGEFATMQQVVDDSMGSQILAARLVGIFALAALAIALAGLYGLLAYAVAQRTREMGIRMALGAERRDILRLVLGHAGWLLALGIAAGLAAALALARVMALYLYGVPARDPATLTVAAVLLAAAGLAAAYLPARRAARISPVEALRAE